jgi:hypothetical protein
MLLRRRMHRATDLADMVVIHMMKRIQTQEDLVLTLETSMGVVDAIRQE